MKENLKHLAYVLTEYRVPKTEDEKGIYLGQDPFWVDAQKILNSKSFRRLEGKTQVWPLAENPLVRNRLTHTMEVYSIAVTIARILGLNEWLAGAIALAHDLGHTPFGHLGERMLSKILNHRLGNNRDFRHAEFSVVVAQEIERKGQGLNLMPIVCDGIKYHSRGSGEMTLLENVLQEFQVVMYADKLAYTFSDISDVLRVGFLDESRLPDILKLFGSNQRECMNTIVMALVEESLSAGKVVFQNSVIAKAFIDLRAWMYKNLYHVLDGEEYRQSLEKKVNDAFSFLSLVIPKSSNAIAVIATMTDYEVLRVADYADISGYQKLKRLGFWESVEYCKNYR